MIGEIISFCDFLKVKQSHLDLHSPIGDEVIIVDGETGLIQKSRRWKEFRGLHGSYCRVRSDGYTVEYDGNPSRWNRKDNIQGIDLDKAKQVVNQIVTGLGLPPFTAEYGLGPDGKVYYGARISRLDVTTNLKAGSPSKAELYKRWIQTQEYPRLQKLIMDNTTYFGRESQTRTLRIYNKGKEFFNTKKCPEAAERLHRNGVLRFEFEYRKFLRQKGFSAWDKATHAALQSQFIEDIQHMTREIEVIDFEDLPAKVLGTYLMYQAGVNPRKKLSKNTFYSHRRELLKYGVDIANMTVERIPQPTKVIALEPYNDDQQELKLG